MATGAIAIKRMPYARWPGTAVAVLVLCLTVGTLAVLAIRAGEASSLRSADLAAIRFTLTQAFVSAALSVLLAVPVARALARRNFRGRGLLITLLGAPFILPVVVAVIGLLAVFGRNGIVSAGLAWFGLPPVTVYGFHGVVLAHVFFNMPLATRMILQGWLAIPAERFRLAESLGAPVGALLEWPMLRAVVPGAFLVIFLICLTSFAVALTLGGGPRATTIELAIFQALRLDFDLGKAALLATIQFGFCALAAVLIWFVTVPEGFGAGLDRHVMRWDSARLSLRLADAAVICAAALFLLVPLGMILWRGLPGLLELPDSIWRAAARSLVVAVFSAALTILITLALALRRGALATLAGVLPLAASSLVMGTGLFLVLFAFMNPAQAALPVTAVVNAVMALPFALRVITPALDRIETEHGRLADSLGLQGWLRLRWLVLPRLRRELGFAAGLAAALSMGDLGVIALFAGAEEATLPLAMYRLMGAYQMETAAGAGLLLLGMSLVLFWLLDRGGRINADTG